MSMTSATVEFEVESFEQVAGGAGLALLRLTGRWRSEAPVELREVDGCSAGGKCEERAVNTAGGGGFDCRQFLELRQDLLAGFDVA